MTLKFSITTKLIIFPASTVVAVLRSWHKSVSMIVRHGGKTIIGPSFNIKSYNQKQYRTIVK